MSAYLDTSAIVSILAAEGGSERVDAWLRTNEGIGLAISPWVDTEVSSALSLKVRTGELSNDQRADALAAWRRMRESLQILPVEQDAFLVAAGYAGQYRLRLRAGDALHLAVAAANACTLVTLDTRMASVAPELGIPVAAL